MKAHLPYKTQSSNAFHSAPFFKKNEDSFFNGHRSESQPFFNPSNIQPKLTIGQPNDRYEQEADQMADRVTHQLSTPYVQKKCTACEKENELQRKPVFESEKEQPAIRTKPAQISNESEGISRVNISNSTMNQGAPHIQRAPDFSFMPSIPGFHGLDLGDILQVLGSEVISNLHLPFNEIPFPFQNPHELPIPWENFLNIDPWEVIRKIIEFLKSIWDLIGPFSGGGGGGSSSTTADPLTNMNILQSPGGSGWRGAIYGCYRNGCRRPHRGWDLYAPVGTNIYAIQSGTVSHHNSAGYGSYIFLTARNTRYRYAHLSARQPAGQYNAGDIIGQTGVTGNANAARPHLHLEVRVNNVTSDPVGFFTVPSQVRAATAPHSITNINTAIPAPCNPCAM